MKRIIGKYVAHVVLDFDVPVNDDTYPLYKIPLYKIKNSICGGEMTKKIGYVLTDSIDNVSVKVEQLYANVYEVDREERK